MRGFNVGFGFSAGSETVVAGLASSCGIAAVGAGSAAATVPALSDGGGDGAGLALPTRSGVEGAAAVTGAGSGVTLSPGMVSAFSGISRSAEVTSDDSGVDEKLAAGLGFGESGVSAPSAGSDDGITSTLTMVSRTMASCLMAPWAMPASCPGSMRSAGSTAARQSA